MRSREAGLLGGWRGTALPWLSGPAIVLGALLLCLPYLLVEVPPLIDLPGHMGAAAIEAAEPGSPLDGYFGWRWMFTLNLGGEVLMKLIGARFGLLAAGWWSTVLATGLYAGGCLALIRMLNPKGGHGAPWALTMVFTFPLLTGFLNYTLAVGLALTTFAAAVWLEDRPLRRAAVLFVLQPIALMCHAIGGILLPLMIGAYAIGRAVEDHPFDLAAARRKPVLALPALRQVIRLCWPLVGAVAMIVVWKAISLSRGHGGRTLWRWDQKAWSFVLTLRDQVLMLDIVTTLLVALLIVGARAMGARWRWSRLLPGLAVFALFVVIPSDIDGSAFCDMRLLPVAAMLLLALADWSAAPPERARFVALSGAGLLLVRLGVTAASFVDYAEDYNRQLGALSRVSAGSRVLAFVEHSCLEENWRNHRRDHLASLASVYRQAWVNDNWSVPGLDMLQPKFRPARYFSADPSEFVWSRECKNGRLRSVDTALRHAPIDMVDYIWLIDTGLPRRPDPRLRMVWQEGRSYLFAVKPLGFSAATLSQM